MRRGHNGEWFGNKAIALVRCKKCCADRFLTCNRRPFLPLLQKVLKNMYVDGILIDTNRDAFDVDCCKDVTVRK